MFKDIVKVYIMINTTMVKAYRYFVVKEKIIHHSYD